MAARVFEATMVLEDNIVDRFVDKYGSSVLETNLPKKRTSSMREALDKEPAFPGEQVRLRSFLVTSKKFV
jgi:hypothetical protein